MRSTFSVRDVGERYAVGIRTVLNWIHVGDLRAVNVSRRLSAKKPRWRITEEALEAFEAIRTPTQQAKARRRRRVDVVEFYR
jgi:hypothetical protein